MKSRTRALVSSSLAAALFSCAFGQVREATSGPLGRYREVTKVEVRAEGAPAGLGDSLSEALESTAELATVKGGGPGVFRLQVEVLDATEAANPEQSRGERVTSNLRNTFGVTQVGDQSIGRLAFVARLLPPEGDEPLAHVRWEGMGAPSLWARVAGAEAGEALGRQVAYRRDLFVPRRAADERLFFVPTALTLDKGEWLFSNDELLLFHLGVGLTRRVQLQLWFGGLPIPAAGGTLLPPLHMLGGVAGAGFGLVGAVDLGVKVLILDETPTRPGLAVSYDLLDAFGGAIGVGGGVAVGDGLVLAAASGAAGANAQFNLFALSAGKHFGHTQVLAGTYVLDNHNILPQSAGFTVGVAAAGDGGTGAGGGTQLAHLPVQVQPFVAVEQVLGPHSALAAEFFPRWPLSASMGTTGARWLLGAEHPSGPLALDRLRLRLDLAGLWFYSPPNQDRANGMIAPVPWIGIGVYGL